MTEIEAKESIGAIVVAKDDYWGEYEGILDCLFWTHNGVRAKVRIISTITQPKQHAIIFKDKPFHRDSYVKGEVKNFDLCNVHRGSS